MDLSHISIILILLYFGENSCARNNLEEYFKWKQITYSSMQSGKRILSVKKKQNFK